mmetsp:Transcript_27791/g.75169  ORF Transcript_27791/g.75169 Transcript_27791/m.75169 type:complete len:221 (-) Transcript_27791:1030-1692(-)
MQICPLLFQHILLPSELRVDRAKACKVLLVLVSSILQLLDPHLELLQPRLCLGHLFIVRALQHLLLEVFAAVLDILQLLAGPLKGSLQPVALRPRSSSPVLGLKQPFLCLRISSCSPVHLLSHRLHLLCSSPALGIHSLNALLQLLLLLWQRFQLLLDVCDLGLTRRHHRPAADLHNLVHQLCLLIQVLQLADLGVDFLQLSFQVLLCLLCNGHALNRIA